MSAKTILVTGGGGLLGRSLAALNSRETRIEAFDRRQLDIADRAAIEAIVEERSPGVLINAAAMTDVDNCEREPSMAEHANVTGPATLAQVCSEYDVRLVQVSTDFVFDGTKNEPYTRDDRPNPLSVYGRTKLEGELAVRDILPGALIVRTSWVFGPGGKNFASRLFDYAARSKELKGITDMMSLPTYAPDLARRILELVTLHVSGVAHVTNSGEPATWYEVARIALDLAGRSDVEVVPVTVASLDLPAPRPKYSAMRCLLSEQLRLSPLRPWKDALAQFVATVSSGAGPTADSGTA